MRGFKQFRLWVLSTGVLLLAVPAFADVVSVLGSSDRQTIPFNRPVPAAIRWQVRTVPKSQSVSSPQLIIGLPDHGMCQPNVTLARSLSGHTGVSGQTTLRETVLIPPAVAVLARKQGAGRIAVCRTFDDGQAAATGIVTLSVSGGVAGAGPLAVDRLQLHFENGSVARVISRGEPLRARADLLYQGAGVLQGYWEVAGPDAGGAGAVFYPLGPVYRRVNGSGHLKLLGPTLPTQLAGRYTVRLRLIAPSYPDSLPQLTYHVLSAEAESSVPVKIKVMPPSAQGVSPQQPLTWQSVKGAKGYLLIVRDPRSGKRVAGEFVPAVEQEQDMIKAALRAVVVQHLQPGHPYLWEVVAVDAQGRSVARSRPIHAVFNP